MGISLLPQDLPLHKCVQLICAAIEQKLETADQLTLKLMRGLTRVQTIQITQQCDVVDDLNLESSDEDAAACEEETLPTSASAKDLLRLIEVPSTSNQKIVFDRESDAVLSNFNALSSETSERIRKAQKINARRVREKAYENNDGFGHVGGRISE